MNFKSIFILVAFLFTLNASAMHHEKSYKFSDCDGKVANYYVSKLISGGTVEGFLEAIKMHQDYYSSRGSEAKVVPLIQYKRSETDDEEIFRVSSMVIYPNLKERTDWISRDDFTEKDTEEFSAFIDIYNKNTEITARRLVCIPEWLLLTKIQS